MYKKTQHQGWMLQILKRKKNKQTTTKKNHKRQEQHGAKHNIKMQSKKHLKSAKKQYIK